MDKCKDCEYLIIEDTFEWCSLGYNIIYSVCAKYPAGVDN